MTENPATPPTFVEATEEFVAAADWLTPAHSPGVVMLRRIAAQLDKDLTAALVAQYGVAYRSLAKERPLDPDAADPLELELRAREAGR